MKKFMTTVCALVLTLTVANAQTEKGTWTFGVGSDFTTVTDVTPNVGYFVMDGLMVSAEFNMGMGDEGETNWGLGGRYYIGDDGLWGGLMLNNADGVEAVEASEGVDAVEGVDDGMDIWLGAGCSKALGFDGKLWFEPTIGYTMPNVGDGSLGLGMGFRLAF